MKRFFTSILRNFSGQAILGLPLRFIGARLALFVGGVFGVFLAGYAVFAFQAPTQAPPAGNVAAPLNTGAGNQTKTGGLLSVFGLWVNQALGVAGGATFGGILNLQGNRITNVGTPTAAGDAATKGFVDSSIAGSAQRGLYGYCAENFIGNRLPSACVAEFEPATCTIESETPWVRIEKCGCSAGYTIVLTGKGDNPDRPYKMYACYKN